MKMIFVVMENEKMDDYISRQAVVDVICDMHIGGKDGVANALPNTYGADIREIIEQIDSLPSLDVQPVQRGHWQEANTHTYGIYECDVCKGWTYIPNEPRDYKFCPRCGARMDGEQND